VPVSAPVTACGNAVGLLGTGTASCTGGGTSTPGQPGQPGSGSTGGSGIGGVSAGSGSGISAEGASALTARPVRLAYTGSPLLPALLAGLILLAGGTGLCLRTGQAGS
jgi:hypothetical protein